MKVSGFFYPVGGAIAVLFVDKASEWDSKLGYGPAGRCSHARNTGRCVEMREYVRSFCAFQ